MILFLLASALSICALLLLRAAWRYRQLYRYLMALDVSQLDAPAPPPALARFSPVHGKLRSLLLERRAQDVTHRQLHFLALQEQINPHFLYNALESVRGKALCVGEYEISDMTEALGNYFRYLISNRSPIVTIESELENIRTYFRIQQFRFGGRYRLEICFDTEPLEIQPCILPKLTLQPLVENAIMHGLEARQEGGAVSIHMTATARRLIIQIRDNGCGIPPALLRRLNSELSALPPTEDGQVLKRIGIRNVSQRIGLVFGKGYGIQLSSIESVGTDVTLTIPRFTRADLHDGLPLRREGMDCHAP